MDNSHFGEILNLDSLRYSDILALLCYHIYNLPSEQKQILYKHVSPIFSNYVQIATETFPFLNSKLVDWNPDPKVSTLIDLVAEQGLEVQSVLLGVICKIDTMLYIGAEKNPPLFLQDKSCPIIDEDACSESFYMINSLNEKTQRYGLLLPKLFCTWTKESNRNQGTVTMDPLTFALHNYYWVPYNAEWKVANLYCDFRKVGDTSHTKAKNLKIVSSPLDCCAPFSIKTDANNHLFYLQYFNCFDERLKLRMKCVIDYAIREEAEIVVFPEMMGTEQLVMEGRECISSYISDLSSTRPKLLLLPTREYQENGSWKNTLDILDENGECIFRYYKKHPFILDKKEETVNGKIAYEYYEPIKTNNEVCVIHVPEIGRIGVIVCSDIFKPDYLMYLVKDLRLTLLLYPVFSKGSDLLTRNLATAEQYSCDVLMCNTCAAWDDAFKPLSKRPPNTDYNHEFISIYYAYGHASNNSTHIFPGIANCTSGDCQGCLFLTIVRPNYRDISTRPQQTRLETL